jgi:hypothetical protein
MNANPHFPACLRLWDIIALSIAFQSSPSPIPELHKTSVATRSG